MVWIRLKICLLGLGARGGAEGGGDVELESGGTWPDGGGALPQDGLHKVSWDSGQALSSELLEEQVGESVAGSLPLCMGPAQLLHFHVSSCLPSFLPSSCHASGKELRRRVPASYLGDRGGGPHSWLPCGQVLGS